MAYITFQPSDYFNTVLYTGNGSSQNITGVGFDPDWIWTKCRSDIETHELYDKVRGATKRLVTNTTAAENTETYQSFITDGFAWSASGNQNISGRTFVSWNWKANGSGSANTDGTISSTVSANTTSGFSIVKYTGNGTDGGTIGHGLSQAPEIVIFKDLSTATSWAVFGYPNNSAFTADGSHLLLDSSSAMADSSTKEVSLSSSTITLVDAGGDIGASGDDYIAYCFHSVKGFSKMGSYIGNGNADGTFVFLGFRPAFIMLKDSSTAYDWQIYDNKRNGYNPNNDDLEPANTSAESNTDKLDILSNGFKLRKADADANTSGDTFIYMAFAEHPLVSSNDIPATAR